MPGIIDPERINVDVLPGIWTPIQWKMSEEEHQVELDAQGTASLLWSVDIPAAILRTYSRRQRSSDLSAHLPVSTRNFKGSGKRILSLSNLHEQSRWMQSNGPGRS